MSEDKTEPVGGGQTEGCRPTFDIPEMEAAFEEIRNAVREVQPLLSQPVFGPDNDDHYPPNKDGELNPCDVVHALGWKLREIARFVRAYPRRRLTEKRRRQGVKLRQTIKLMAELKEAEEAICGGESRQADEISIPLDGIPF